MSNKEDRKKTYRDLIWTTGDGSRIAIKRMTTSHLQNTVKFIERNKMEHLEKDIPNERSLKMELAKFLSTQAELKKVDSPGAEYLEPAIEDVKKRLNTQFVVPQTAIAEALSDHEHYQGMISEIERRNIVTDNKPELLDVVPFLETKMDVKVKDIIPNPNEIAMIIEVVATQEMSEKIKTGDYIVDCNNPLFQICYLARYHDMDKDSQMALTINARTPGEKAKAMQHLKVGESIVIY